MMTIVTRCENVGGGLSDNSSVRETGSRTTDTWFNMTTMFYSHIGGPSSDPSWA